jgi:hypothetical protein
LVYLGGKGPNIIALAITSLDAHYGRNNHTTENEYQAQREIKSINNSFSNW